jgi:Zn-dependent protease
MAYDDPRFDPLAILSKSFRVGRIGRTEVRVYVTAVFVLLVGVTQFLEWPGVGFLGALGAGLLSTALLYAIVLTHELGHALAARRYGIPTPTITLSAFGGLAHMSAPAPNPRAELWITLAGPVTHLPWIGLGYALAGRVPPLDLGGAQVDFVPWIWQANLGLLVFNLLPAFPMDGGRALRALLSMRMHPNRATLIACRVGILAAIGIAAWGLRTGGFGGGILVVIGLNNIFSCMREMTAARHSDGPYGAADPWATDGDEWKRGVPPERHAEIAAEVIGRPLPPSSRRRTAAQAEELDRLLARVSEVGIAGLSPAERERLRGLSAPPGR